MSLRSQPVSPINEELGTNASPDTEPVNEEEERSKSRVEGDEPEGVNAETQGEDDQHDDEEAGETLRCLPCPGSPSLADRAAHEIAHWPYRPWCEWCVRGRAVG